MRIGLVVPGGVDRSGRERVTPVLLWLIERLARRHTVTVVVLDYYPEPCSYELLGATVHDLGRPSAPPGLRRWDMSRRLSRFLDSHPGSFDVLHAFWGVPAGIVATAAGRQRAIPVVVTLSSGELVRVDDIAYGLQRRWIDRRAIARLLGEASAVTVPTTFMANLLAPHGVRPVIISDGCDPGSFARRERSDGPPWRLIRVGSLNAVKDHPTLMRAMATLVSAGLDVRLDVVGEDTLGGRVQALASELGVAGRVTFHGWLPTDRVADLLAAAHVHVVSSRHEASSVTMLEAACAGVPTVGTRVGYVADWEPDRAVAVPVADPSALADAIAALLADAPRRARLAESARAWAIAHDADWTAERFEEVYRKVTRG